MSPRHSSGLAVGDIELACQAPLLTRQWRVEVVTVWPTSGVAWSSAVYGPASFWVSGSGAWARLMLSGRASSATVARAPRVISCASTKSLAEVPMTSLAEWMYGLYWTRSSNGKIAGKPCRVKLRWSLVPPERLPLLIARPGT